MQARLDALRPREQPGRTVAVDFTRGDWTAEAKADAIAKAEQDAGATGTVYAIQWADDTVFPAGHEGPVIDLKWPDDVIVYNGEEDADG